MRFTPEFLDELRAALPVSEVVGRRVKLKKAGREWKGLSPFNQEKTPSFFVNDQKAAWFDFSSGRNGSIFDFVMATEGVTFPEAVERLAQMAGMQMPAVSPEAVRQEERRRTLYDVIELAAKFFEQTLASRVGAKARGYLADRGIEPATQLKFRIGYAPGERFALKEYLGKEGVSVEDMNATGLLVNGDDIPVPYDRFRDRVMFPIADMRGRLIAFGGRALEKDVPAKYLNSPETPLFHKGSNLYNGASARVAAHNGASIVVVEGYVDVIAMVTAGYEGAVAPLGTALTEDQIGLIWKMDDEPILCFDGDGAGRRAAYRAVDIALPRLQPGKSVRFASLPEGQDPDDLARSGGPAALAEVLDRARPLADMLWMRETEAGGFDTPERRAALESRVSEILAGVGNEQVRKYYRQDFGLRLSNLLSPPAAYGGAPYGGGGFQGRGSQFGGKGGQGNYGGGPGGRYGNRARGRDRFGSLENRKEPLATLSPKMSVSPIVRGTRSAFPSREALILLAVMNHPWLLQNHAEEVAEIDFLNPEADTLRHAILECCADESMLDSKALHEALIRRGLQPALGRVMAAITHTSDWPAREGAAEQDVSVWWEHVVTLHHKKRRLNKELQLAEKALGEDPSDANLAALTDVQGRLSALEGGEAQIEGFGALSGRLGRGV